MANFFWVPKVAVSARRVEAFVREFGPRMAYIHLKPAGSVGLVDFVKDVFGS